MTTLNSGEGKAAPNFQEIDDSRVIALAQRVRDGVLLSEAQRDYLKGAGSDHEAPASLAADLGLHGFVSMRGLAKASFDADADRRLLIVQSTKCAKGEWRPDDQAHFLSKLRRLRGLVPATVLQALHLPAGASWGVVAERLDSIISPTKGAGR